MFTVFRTLVINPFSPRWGLSITVRHPQRRASNPSPSLQWASGSQKATQTSAGSLKVFPRALLLALARNTFLALGYNARKMLHYILWRQLCQHSEESRPGRETETEKKTHYHHLSHESSHIPTSWWCKPTHALFSLSLFDIYSSYAQESWQIKLIKSFSYHGILFSSMVWSANIAFHPMDIW